MAALLIVGSAAVGGLVGMAPARMRTGLLASAAALTAILVFLPGRCATATASTPLGDPEQLQGQTSCDTLYGASLPEIGPLQADLAGTLLAVAAATIAALATVLVRRRRLSTSAGKRADPC